MGGVLVACAKKLYESFSIEVADLLELRDCLQLATNWGIKVVIVESDILLVVQNINSSSLFADCAFVCQDVRSPFSYVRYVPIYFTKHS